VSFWVGLSPDDPLFSTVCVLPVVVAACLMLEGYGRRLGARSLGGPAAVTEGVAAVLLLWLAVGRGSLGLPLAAPVVMAGFTLLLLFRMTRQLVAARPLLGRTLPQRPPLFFFALPLLVYLAILPWSSEQRQPDGDEPFYLLITHSLTYDRDADLANNYAARDSLRFMNRAVAPQPGDPVGPEGERYSRHNELLPLVLVPAYAVAGRWGALATMAAMAALLAWMVLWLARCYFPRYPAGALLAYGLFALTPPMLYYAHQIWVEVPAALLAMVALERMHEPPRRHSGSLRWDLRRWLGIGLPLMLLPLVKIRFMLLSIPLLALAWLYARRPWRPLIVLFVLLGLLGVGILGFNQVRYGNPLKIHSVEELALHEIALLRYLEGGVGLFFDTAFGLFASAPLWLLILPAVGVAWRHRSGGRRLMRDLLLFSLPYLVIVAPRLEWYGGWSPHFRYGLFCLPMLALLLVPLLEQRHRAGARFLVGLLGALTVVLTLLWVAVPGWSYNFADGRSYLLDHLSGQWGADVARLFPSYVRPRLATWVWPVLATAVVCLLWRWPRRARSAGTVTAAGALSLLAVLAVLPGLARQLPTRVVEAEDAFVLHDGGHPHPERWVIERTRYQGGWVLRPREGLTMPVVAAGERVELLLTLRFVRNSDWPMALRIRAGETDLYHWEPTADRGWEEVAVGPVEWPGGASLELRVEAPSPPEARLLNGILVDRVEFRWLH
jgi:hypothetical protein